MPMNLHGNYVYPGLSYPSYTLPPPNAMAQPSAPYSNPHMLYYPTTNPAYTGLPPVYPPPDLYSSPTFLSHLKAIADNILASDARTRKRGAKSKISTKLTPPVKRPVTETLDELRSSAYYRYMQVAPTTTLPLEYPSTPKQDRPVPSTPTEFVTISSDSDEEFIDVEDIDGDGDDITALAHTPNADFPPFGEVLPHKTGDLPQFVATFNEDPRYTVTSDSTNLMLMKCHSFVTTTPHSDTDAEKSNEAYPTSSFVALTKRRESYGQLFGVQKSLNDTGEKWGSEQRHSPHIDQRVYINGTSWVELENAMFPPRPPSAPLRLRTPSEVYDEGLEQNKQRPVRPRSEPAVLFDETWIRHRTPKQIRTENLACTLKSKRKPFPGDNVKRTVLPHAIETLVDCGVRSPVHSQEQSCSVAGTQLTPPSYAKQKSVTHDLPQPCATIGTTAPSVSEPLLSSPSCAYATPPTSEVAQPTPGFGATAPTNAWPWFGLPSISDLMSFTPQVGPYATGASQYGAGTTPSSVPHKAPQLTATTTSAWPWLGLHSGQAVHAKPAEAQFGTGAAPSYTSGASIVYADPQANSGLGTDTRTWSWQWSRHQSVSPHEQIQAKSIANGKTPSYSGNTSPVNLAPHTSGKECGANVELRSRTSRVQLVPAMTSAPEPPNHMTAPNSQVSTPERVKTSGLLSNGFSEANQRNPLLHNSKRPNSKRKSESPKIEVSPKYQRARKPGRVSAQPPKQRRMFPDEAQNTHQMQAPIFTSIGARGTLVRRDFYDIIVWDDYVQCTKLLMQFIFNFRSLATLTLDGPDRLDPNIVHDIATHVSVKCGIPVEQVHHTMRHVCSVAKKCFEESNHS